MKEYLKDHPYGVSPDIGVPDYYGVKNKVLKNKHPNRKNNQVVAAMYSAYQSGMSLEQIAKLYRKTRQCVYDLFRSRGYPLRSKQHKGLTIIDGVRFTETKGGYLRGTFNKKRILAHWYVWEKAHGPIPAGYVIHHKDHDPKNNSLENLELVARDKMGKTFNPNGRNQFSTSEKIKK